MKDFFSDLPIKNSNENRKLNTPMVNSQSHKPENPVGVSAPIPLTSETSIAMGVVDITKESIRCFTEYMKCKEHEITERQRINATLQAVQYQINAQKEVYLNELEKNFEERNRLYDMAEKTQQKALELGDKEMLQLCYNLILNVYTKACGNNGGMPSLLGGFCGLL